MVETYKRKTPLANLGLEKVSPSEQKTAKSLLMTEIPFIAKVNLRGDPANKTFLKGVKAALNIQLPKIPNTVSGKFSQVQAIWLGPDEWLLTGRSGAEAKLLKNLHKQTENMHVAITDITDSRTILQLSGGPALSIIMKGCTLDLHPNVFKPGQCAQTVLAKTNVIIHLLKLDKKIGPTLHIYVQNSFAEHLWLWLVDATPT